MQTAQPEWKFLNNLGDNHPIDYGGYFILEDKTGVYDPEAIWLESPDSDESKEPWIVYRFSLEPHTYINGILSDNKYHPDHAVWYAEDINSLSKDIDVLPNILIEMFCSNNPIQRAIAYREVLQHWGPENFDFYPLIFKTREEIENYLKDHVTGKR